ncbi:hypothetical protein BJ508DRAFT_171853 [Ascobolus immersus RN42]|uniref:Uncharacterized protein n=1 Tax=Ascobolus immersus RN42 TaxID=1160509 RepID=A0A3N4HZF7_ASCIM|nr:hypothetical protein BJ508DRAFT_171853 [Ascobolus immersus RN42]
MSFFSCSFLVFDLTYRRPRVGYFNDYRNYGLEDAATSSLSNVWDLNFMFAILFANLRTRQLRLKYI